MLEWVGGSVGGWILSGCLYPIRGLPTSKSAGHTMALEAAAAKAAKQQL